MGGEYVHSKMAQRKLNALREQILSVIDETGDHTHPRVLALSEEMDRLLNRIMGIGVQNNRRRPRRPRSDPQSRSSGNP